MQAEAEGHCCMCKARYSSYRGQFKCTGEGCGVPVIVCPGCSDVLKEHPEVPRICPLCEEGYKAPQKDPDLLQQKRKLGVIVDGKDLVSGQVLEPHLATDKKRRRRVSGPATRLFVGRLPRVVTATTLRTALAAAAGQHIDPAQIKVQWVVDRRTKAFYGSAFVGMARLADAERVLSAAQLAGGALLIRATAVAPRRRAWRARVAFAELREGEAWPPVGYRESEFPPIGTD